MKKRFMLFQRSGILCCDDTGTGKETPCAPAPCRARRLLAARNEAQH
jgi:hypothetical protein